MSFANEKVVETKKCEKTGVLFDITDKDLEFYDKVSPVFNGKKYSIPTPKLCPESRQQRKLSFRNERNLYRRKCDFSGEDIISNISPDKPYKVYSSRDWWGDKWEGLDYGRSFDFSKTFEENFNSLMLDVPHLCIVTDYTKDVNSDYTNYAGYNKNCYLSFDIDYSEDVYYSHSSVKNKNCFDTTACFNSENCYECLDTRESNFCFFSKNLSNCSYMYYCENCEGAKNCYASSNIMNGEYYFENEKLSKEEYKEKLKKALESGKKPEINKTIFKSTEGYNRENISGNYINNTKNSFNSYELNNCEEVKYSIGLNDAKVCHDILYFGAGGIEYCYNNHIIGDGAKNVLFSSRVVGNNSNIYYSYFIHNNSSNLFCCVGLKNKEYCILNKQYTKEEYEELAPKIIKHMQRTGEWGEFFPASISPFGYNETVAQEYFPLTKEEAIK